MSFRIILFTLLVGSMIACTPSKEDLKADIQKSEDTLYGEDPSFRFDPDLADEAIEAYEAYANAYPEETVSADYLFKAADLYRAKKKYGTAITIYERIQSDFAEYEKVPHSLFLQGFVYENEMVDLEKAKEKYTEFIGKYPNHELADDVEFSLANLGKTPEEIIRGFEEKQKEMQVDTTAAEEVPEV